MMTIKEQFIFEIKERIALQKDLLKLAEDSARIEGSIDALLGLLNSINTLSEESDKNLEKAAEEYEKKHIYQRYDGGGLTPEYDATLAEAFNAGAEWREQQIPKLPDNLDKAAEKFAKENCENYVDEEDGVTYIEEALRNTFKAGAEWQAERLLKGSPMPEDTVIFEKGIEEGKRLMMKDAVEGKVYKFGEVAYVKECNNTELTKYLSQFNNGDRVKIIVIHETDIR